MVGSDEVDLPGFLTEPTSFGLGDVAAWVASKT
jgi:hypothetical protein